MGFFKDFKDDFSQAINELLPGEDFNENDEIQVNTLDSELDVEKELSKLDGLLEQVEKKAVKAVETEAEPELAPLPAEESYADTMETTIEEIEAGVEEPTDESDKAFETVDTAEEAGNVEVEPEVEEKTPFYANEMTEEPEMVAEEPQTLDPAMDTASDEGIANETEENVSVDVEETSEDMAVASMVNVEVTEEQKTETDTMNYTAEADKAEDRAPQAYTADEFEKQNDIIKEEKTMDTMDTNVTTEVEVAEPVMETVAPVVASNAVTDEVSVITAGTSIKGNMETTGSFEIEGRIEGDIKCNGKLTVIGSILGNSSSSEFFADAAHIEGEVVSSGTVKVGLGSVIIGNITATSAVIAGAVKGDIDVQGPVVVDTSAVIMGNIKSRSVQINNGAVIEGFCSQCYSDVDVESLFSKNK